MKVRPCAEFRSDLPDDVIEGDEGFIQYGGESVTRAIGEMLVRCGCQVDEPICVDEAGWDVNVTVGKRHLWYRVSLIENYVFSLSQNWWLGKIFNPYSPEYIDVLTRLSRELADDPRFHDVRWYAEGEVLSGLPGTDSPVID